MLLVWLFHNNNLVFNAFRYIYSFRDIRFVHLSWSKGNQEENGNRQVELTSALLMWSCAALFLAESLYRAGSASYWEWRSKEHRLTTGLCCKLKLRISDWGHPHGFCDIASKVSLHEYCRVLDCVVHGNRTLVGCERYTWGWRAHFVCQLLLLPKIIVSWLCFYCSVLNYGIIN